jgi:hypothetical protein
VYRAKYVEVLMGLMLTTHREYDTPAELCEAAEQILRQLPGAASAQLTFEEKPVLEEREQQRDEETVYVASPSARSLKSRTSSRMFFANADGSSPMKQAEGARALTYVWDSSPNCATLTVLRTSSPTAR